MYLGMSYVCFSSSRLLLARLEWGRYSEEWGKFFLRPFPWGKKLPLFDSCVCDQGEQANVLLCVSLFSIMEVTCICTTTRAGKTNGAMNCGHRYANNGSPKHSLRLWASLSRLWALYRDLAVRSRCTNGTSGVANNIVTRLRCMRTGLESLKDHKAWIFRHPLFSYRWRRQSRLVGCQYLDEFCSATGYTVHPYLEAKKTLPTWITNRMTVLVWTWTNV